jgi:hypothetical protein
MSNSHSSVSHDHDKSKSQEEGDEDSEGDNGDPGFSAATPMKKHKTEGDGLKTPKHGAMLADYQDLLFGKELKQTGESGGSSEISQKKKRKI